ncbi:TIR domain-containing protein [Paractinoplanes lichenicola]|uniref:Nucleotide-binding protein n=1 Tax=Paractinoplanes lichenicola TaxID=2802976 RepID=A0ABS1W1P2_9ACTN|nr:TIR domain-containing protein [Actinoplanes lichenicola]MBL7260659.1 nucleotide-binding protein [Actinoplanes lichenicola]
MKNPIRVEETMVANDGAEQIVAVAYGRDLHAKDAVETLISDLGLVPLSFDQAIMRAAGGLPNTWDAVQSLFEGVQAVVVVFTPDDLAITHPDLWRGEADAFYAGQPRQNVLIETGMAISALPEKTVLARIGEVRQATNLDGLNVVDLATPGGARRLANFLQRAGCAIDQGRLENANLPNIEQIAAEARSREKEPVYSERGISIFEAARLAGLRDIEYRSGVAKSLPPDSFYKRADVELAISGVTASLTFQTLDDVVLELLRRDPPVSVKVLVLDPDTPDMQRLSKREKRPLAEDVHAVYEAIRHGGFTSFPTFEIRLAPFMYPFTGVMLDGDIGAAPSGESQQIDDPSSFRSDAELRVQPGGYYTTQHLGPVLQFHNTETPGPFHHFATDFRRQWAHSRPISIDTLEELVDE